MTCNHILQLLVTFFHKKRPMFSKTDQHPFTFPASLQLLDFTDFMLPTFLWPTFLWPTFMWLPFMCWIGIHNLQGAEIKKFKKTNKFSPSPTAHYSCDSSQLG